MSLPVVILSLQQETCVCNVDGELLDIVVVGESEIQFPSTLRSCVRKHMDGGVSMLFRKNRKIY